MTTDSDALAAAVARLRSDQQCWNALGVIRRGLAEILPDLDIVVEAAEALATLERLVPRGTHLEVHRWGVRGFPAWGVTFHGQSGSGAGLVEAIRALAAKLEAGEVGRREASVADDDIIFEPQQSQPTWEGKIVSASYLESLRARLTAVEQQLADCTRSHQRTNRLLEEALDEREETELTGWLREVVNEQKAGISELRADLEQMEQERDQARAEVVRLREVLQMVRIHDSGLRHPYANCAMCKCEWWVKADALLAEGAEPSKEA